MKSELWCGVTEYDILILHMYMHIRICLSPNNTYLYVLMGRANHRICYTYSPSGGTLFQAYSAVRLATWCTVLYALPARLGPGAAGLIVIRCIGAIGMRY